MSPSTDLVNFLDILQVLSSATGNFSSLVITNNNKNELKY